MKRVLFLTNYPSPYRVCFFDTLGREMDVTVLFSERAEEKKHRDANWFIESQGTCRLIQLERRAAKIGSKDLCLDVIEWLKKPFDHIVICGYSSPTMMLAMGYLRMKKIPFYIEVDGGLIRPDSRPKYLFKKMLVSGASWWISSGAYTTKYLTHYGAKEERVYCYPFTSLWEKDILKTPVSPEEKAALRSRLGIKEGRLVLSVGRFDRGKGFDTLLKAAAALPADVGVCIVGGEPTEAYLKLREELGLTNVHFCGFQKKEELALYYQAADLFALATRSDVWGLVVNEAMAAGLPVVTTDRCVAGLELVENGVNGYIVPVDDAEAMGRRMNDVLEGDTARMGAAALKTAGAYTIENMAKAHVDIFGEVIMHIVYAVTTCSDRVYKQLFDHVAVKPAFQSQKYHRLLIEGLAAHCQVDVVANPPVNKRVLNENYVRLPRETEGGADYRYIPAIRNPVLKLLAVGVGTFVQTLCLADKDSAVIVDGLNRVTALAGLLAARLRGRPCIGIVTDLPDMLGGSGFSKKFANFVIGHCTHYILLTEAMNDYLNHGQKPYVILEGHSDITMRDRIPSMDRKTAPRVCFYAGGVSKQYGLQNLVEGFRKADLPNARLHIYGPGDYVKELQQIASEDSRVFYGGMLLNTQIIDKEMEATLLVNPRPTGEEYVKYSFPSKTMEYMSTGTPVLTTVLPGMPKEYHPYVYLLEDETADGIAARLREVLSRSDEELFQKGQAARAFILDEKNNVIQGKKILDMLEK